MNESYIHTMKKLLYLALILLAGGCRDKEPLPEAYGNFEALEILVPAQTSGVLVEWNLEEGQKLKKGRVIGLVDTLPLHLKKRQLLSQVKAVLTRLEGVDAEVKVLEKQLEMMEKDLERTENLLADGAATQKQYDDLLGNMEVLRLKKEAVKAQKTTILAEREVLNMQILQLDDQIARSVLTCPAAGTVLQKYTEVNEMVVPGKALFKLACLDTLYLRAYLGATRLDDVRIGQEVTVRFDRDENSDHTLPGIITWISSSAEFTPNIIQTKEERVTLVYAVKVAVKNNGMLKVGMPGEMVMLKE
ncbi:MAG: HlyD family secretion protein [Bacteroidales bacterium]